MILYLPSRPSFADFGGIKKDFTAPEHDDTDRKADEVNAVFFNVAAMIRTADLARCSFFIPDTIAPGQTLLPTNHDAVWGSNYTVQPSLSIESTGQYLLIYPETIITPFGTTEYVNIKYPKAQCSWNGGAYQVTASPNPGRPNEVRISVVDNTLFFSDPINEILTVFCG